jgi:molybdate transport system ATP-binding protein
MLRAKLKKAFPPQPDTGGFTLDLEFTAHEGVTILFGPSGSGKTMVLDAIAGFVRPDEGRILLDEDLLYDGATGVHLSPQARNFGYVLQHYALFPHMTVRENLAFAAERRPRLERHRRVNDMLERFRLNDVAGLRPREISGGQRQRCSIARALIGAPKLLLLDEPTTGLDAPLKAEFYEILRQVRADFSTPILMVTHDLEECFELGDEMLVISHGRIAQSASPRDILAKPANADVARLLGVFNLLSGELRGLDPGRNTSRIQIGEHEIEGPYFPAHLIGDHVTLCVRPEQLTAVLRHGRIGPNQIPATLLRAVERPQWMRLEFAGGLTVDLPHAEYERQREGQDPANQEWLVQFPAASLRVL